MLMIAVNDQTTVVDDELDLVEVSPGCCGDRAADGRAAGARHAGCG